MSNHNVCFKPTHRKRKSCAAQFTNRNNDYKRMVEQALLTEDEAALYDRQIRLWGLDAQRRLRAAKVLLIGLRGLGAEVAKNIVLSGIKSLTLLDHTQVTEEDACSQFLACRSNIGKNRAESSLQRTQQLNPMVDVRADSENVVDKPDDFFAQFDVVCATCCDSAQLNRINKLCTDNNAKFYAGDVFGYYGYMFSDLGVHEYAVDVPKKKKAEEQSDDEPASKKAKMAEEETVTVKKTETFSRLCSALEYDWSTVAAIRKLRRTPSMYFIMHILLQFQTQEGRRPLLKSHDSDLELLNTLRSQTLDRLKVQTSVVAEDFAKHCFSELSPVCAVVGGILGQEIIKAVSQKDLPHNNFFFYNGVDGSGLVDKIG